MATTTISPAVQHALGQISETHYTLEDDGSRLPQTSAPGIIATMLDLLQVEPGRRVLEIGTGSGHSTALLSHLAGDAGSVVSVDRRPGCVPRAARQGGDCSTDSGRPAARPVARWRPGRTPPTSMPSCWPPGPAL